MLFGTLGASLLSDMLTKNLSGKGTVRAGEEIKKKNINATTGEGTIRAGEEIKKKSINATTSFDKF